MNIRYVEGEATTIAAITDGYEVRYINNAMKNLLGITNLETLWALAITEAEIAVLSTKSGTQP